MLTTALHFRGFRTGMLIALALFALGSGAEPLDGAIAIVQQGWGELGIDTAAHAPGKEGRAMQIGATTYEAGLGTHANSRILVDLWGEYAAFEAVVGVQAQPTAQPGSVVFRVVVDGEERFDSGVMRQADAAKPVRVDLEGALEMELVVTDAGDGIICDVANWAEARLVKSATPSARRAQEAFDIGPFARVVTWDPGQTGSHPNRVEELSIDQIFLETDLMADADGCYIVPAGADGESCIGLQWYENRYLREVGVVFAGGEAPKPEGARAEWWVGESAWQGDWKPLAGEPVRDGKRWRVRVGRVDLSAAQRGVQKVRWVFPGSMKPVRVERLEAFTRSRTEVADVRIEMHTPAGAPQSCGVEVYNGTLLEGPENGSGPVAAGDKPCRLKVRYCRTRPGYAKSDRTVLRLTPGSGAFGVAVEDVVEHGCVYVPDFGVFVTREPDGPTYEGYKESIAGRVNVIDRVRAMPDQTFGQAMKQVHRAVQNNGPTMLSLACDNHKFIVHENGRVQYRMDPETHPGQDRKKAVYSPEMPLEVIPTFADGEAEERSRRLEGDWLPIVLSEFEGGGVVYTQRSFVAPFEGAAASGSPNWLNPKPLFVAELTVTNGSSEPADALIELSVLDDVAEKKSAALQQVSGGVVAYRGEQLLAFLAPGDMATTIQEGRVRVAGRLPAGGSGQCFVYVPAWPAKVSEGSAFGEAGDLAERVVAYWESIMGSAVQLDIPDSFLLDVVRASQVHCYMAARNEAGGERVSAWCASDRYGPLESESQAIIHGMGLMGHDEFARRSLDFFIARYNEDGLLTTGYTLMGMGWHLWTLADYYARSHNDAWFESVAPELERACNWIVRESEKTKRLRPGGERIPEYGLVSPGVAADWSRFAYRARPEGEYYAGLVGVARAYEAIGYPSAERLLGKAEEFRQNIQSAYNWTQACSPVLQLRDGTWIPYCPAFFGCFGRVMDIYPNEDGGRSWGKDMSMGAHNLVVLGVLDEADHRSVEWIADYLEDFWCLQGGMGAYPKEEAEADWYNLGGFSKVQPYYTRLVEVYGRLDDVKPFIRSYFNAIPSLLNTENLTLWEHFGNGGAWNKTHETGWFLAQTRLMLVMERGDALWLAPFVPDHWMRDGMCVAIENAPTHFGEVGYRIESHTADGYMEAKVSPPRHSAADHLVLRVRHPEGAPIQSVLVNGGLHEDYDVEGNTIRLDPHAKELQVRVEF